MSRPQTFKELGMKFTQDEDCSVCQTGKCHNRVTATRDNKEYSVEVIVQQEYCSDSCNAPEFIIDVRANANTFSDDDENVTFYSEADAINYLFDKFDYFECSKYP